MSQFLSLYITAPSCQVAETIGRTLVEERLVACVNIIDGSLLDLSLGRQS
jgi:uncharacterized protein involved in tolerance to divalent cations